VSYASRLAAMSRGQLAAATPRVIASDAESPRAEIVETDLPAPQAVAPPPAVAPRTPRPPESRTATATVRPPGTPVPLPATAVEESGPAIASAPVIRETIDRHTIVEVAPPPPRESVIAVPPPSISEPVALSPQAKWLAEDATAPDPLVASTDDHALRELMRSVRQWTSSAPTVIEQHHHESSTTPTPSAPAVVAPAPTQVSIGNVTITVEDAPAAPGRRTAAAPHGAASDRMARNHIRGG
jgi:hypothetical protein